MGKPRPVPPTLRVVEVSTWVNSWKTASSWSSGMPMPVSFTLIKYVVFFARHVDGDLAFLGEFDGVVDQVDHHLAQADFVSIDLHFMV